MAKNTTANAQSDTLTSGQGDAGGNALKTHMRVRYDEKKNLLINHGCWFALDIYNEYRKIARPGSTLKPLKASRTDASGKDLFSTACWFRASLLRKYERIAFFDRKPIYVLVGKAMEAHLPDIEKTSKRRNTYDLINEAMEAYLPTLKKSHTQKLLEKDQEELEI